MGEYMRAYNIGLRGRLRLLGDRLRYGCLVKVPEIVVIANLSLFSLGEIIKVIPKAAIIFVFIVFIKVVVVCLFCRAVIVHVLFGVVVFIIV